MSELQAYTLLVLVGFLPSEIWRMLGLVVARGVADESELFMWVRTVAIAVLAGVIAKIILFPPGTLAGVPLVIRLALSITHNLGGLGSVTDWQNLESKESLVIPC